MLFNLIYAYIVTFMDIYVKLCLRGIVVVITGISV